MPQDASVKKIPRRVAVEYGSPLRGCSIELGYIEIENETVSARLSPLISAD